MNNVTDWRNLYLKQDIHYCEENTSTDSPEPNQVYKREKWFLSSNRKVHQDRIVTPEQYLENINNKHITEITFCPFCGIDLNTLDRR